MGVWLWTAAHGTGRMMGSFFTPTSSPLFGTRSGAGCTRSCMSTVGPPRRPSPGASFLNSLLPSRWCIRGLQNRTSLYPISPVIQSLSQWKILCSGCNHSLYWGRLGRQCQGSWRLLCSVCSELHRFNIDKNLLFDIPAFSWIPCAFAGEAIVMVHACHFWGNSGHSRGGSVAGPDWGQRPGLYLDSLGRAWLGGLSGLALSQQGHRGQGFPHLMGRSCWRSQS